ncbi:MAG: hypothetical protein U0Y82_05285 [Thermoleophilia bacterium]
MHLDTVTPRSRKWTDRVAVAVPRSGASSMGWNLGTGGPLVAAWRVGGGVRVAEVGVTSTRGVVPLRVPSGDATGRLSVAVGVGGARAVAWSTVRGGMGSSVRLPEDISWRPARRVGRDAGASAPRIAVGCDGGVVGAWTQPGTTAGTTTIKESTAQGTHGLPTDPREVTSYGDATKTLSVWGVSVVGRSGLAMVGWQRAQNGGAGEGAQLQGDRTQYAVRGFGFDGNFRAGPPAAFADDGTGLFVAATTTGVLSQQFTPGDDVLSCR